MFKVGRMRDGGSSAREERRDREIDVDFEASDTSPGGDDGTLSPAISALMRTAEGPSAALEALDYDADPDTSIGSRALFDFTAAAQLALNETATIDTASDAASFDMSSELEGER